MSVGIILLSAQFLFLDTEYHREQERAKVRAGKGVRVQESARTREPESRQTDREDANTNKRKELSVSQKSNTVVSIM